MSIKSIIIDNKQTTAKRVSSDKVQLNLVAIPLDEQNDAEPNLNLRLYINGQLFQNLQSGPDWRVNESVVIDSTDAEQITIEIEDVVQWVKSKIKCVMIEELPQVEDKPIQIKENTENTQKLEKERKKKEILAFVGKNGWNLSDEKCKEYINDLDVATAAVKQNPLALQFTSDNLRNNYEFVLSVVKQDWLALKGAADAIKGVPEICAEAIKNNMFAYDLCPEEILLHDQVLWAVCEAGFTNRLWWNHLKKLPKDTKDRFDQMCFLQGTIYFASAPLSVKSNKKIILCMITNAQYQEDFIVQYMSSTLRNDTNFIKDIFQTIAKKNYDQWMHNYVMKNIKKLLKPWLIK